MKKFVNFKFVVMFALALVANVASCAQDNVIDEVVWVIGDEAILKSMWKKHDWPLCMKGVSLMVILIV